MKDSREFKDSVIRGATMDLLSAGRLVAFDDHGLVRVTAGCRKARGTAFTCRNRVAAYSCRS